MFMSLSLQGLNPEACTYWANGLSLFYTPSLPAMVLFICLHRLSLFSLYFLLTSHIAARLPFYYTFPLLDFETALKITRSSHCSMPTALALLRGMFRSPTDPCHYQLEMFLQSFLQGSFFLCVQGIQHPKTNSVLFIRFYLWPYHNFSQTPFFILFTNCCLLY